MINDAEERGQIFLHFGSVLIAVSASQPFKWEPDAGIRAPAGKVPSGCSEFRVMATRCAVAIETALPGTFADGSANEQLTAFRAAVRSKSLIRSDASGEENSRWNYASRNGHTLSCVFNGEDRIDGDAINYGQWPQLQSPWYFQATSEAARSANTLGSDTGIERARR